ncbi:MAG: hypothetical protein R3C68_09090 [Myxococcota bacterium]
MADSKQREELPLADHDLWRGASEADEELGDILVSTLRSPYAGSRYVAFFATRFGRSGIRGT